jgi:hypothetical protein
MAHGRYDTTAGLKPLGDRLHYQIDDQYPAFMRAKEVSRAQDRAGVYLTHDYSPALHRAMATFMLHQLPTEHPAWFATEVTGQGAVFHNRLLGLSARLDLSALVVTEAWRERALLPGGETIYDAASLVGADAIDFLTLQVQEDWAVTSIDPDTKRDWVSALHISYPNHWDPSEKVGQSFLAVHAPVAAMEATLKAAPALIDMMLYKGPWERFAWAIAPHTTLNCHPSRVHDQDKRLLEESAAGVKAAAQLRVEREVLKGFPEAHGSVFMIRTYFTPIAEIAQDDAKRQALAAALRSMKPESVVYKGLSRMMEHLLAYLDAPETV